MQTDTSDKCIKEYTELLDYYEAIGGYTYQKEYEIMLKKFGFIESDNSISYIIVATWSINILSWDTIIIAFLYFLKYSSNHSIASISKWLVVIGENGIGKSTLLKTINEIIKPLQGKVSYGYNVSVGYFDQSLGFEIENGTILEEFKAYVPELTIDVILT